MLSTSARLRQRGEFGSAVRRGRGAGQGHLVVHLLMTEERRAPRGGVVVSKAVGSAVVRNTVKRRLRHLMREKMPLLPEGSLLVVRALPSAAGASSTRLGADLDNALERVRRSRVGHGGRR